MERARCVARGPVRLSRPASALRVSVLAWKVSAIFPGLGRHVFALHRDNLIEGESNLERDHVVRDAKLTTEQIGQFAALSVLSAHQLIHRWLQARTPGPSTAFRRS